ncbi:FAD-dependent monooxygenase [Nonomuraea rubra]|uniref:FAD-dependent monooxygenase n=1 Tax=Nonomuraea rubra TaxID=46180 RepID=UPI003615F8D9
MAGRAGCAGALGHTVADLEQDGDGVEVTVESGGRRWRTRAAYLAGCDGSRSLVRKRAGIGFPARPPPTTACSRTSSSPTPPPCRSA